MPGSFVIGARDRLGCSVSRLVFSMPASSSQKLGSFRANVLLQSTLDGDTAVFFIYVYKSVYLEVVCVIKDES